MLVNEKFKKLTILRLSRVLLSSKHRISFDPEQIDKIKSGNKVLEPKIRLRQVNNHTANVNEDYFTRFF